MTFEDFSKQLKATDSAFHRNSKEYKTILDQLNAVMTQQEYLEASHNEDLKKVTKIHIHNLSVNLLKFCDDYLKDKGESRSTTRGTVRMDLIQNLRAFTVDRVAEFNAKAAEEDKEEAIPEVDKNKLLTNRAFSGKADAAKHYSCVMVYDKDGKAHGPNYMLRTDIDSFYMPINSDKLQECKFQKNKDGAYNIVTTGSTMDVKQYDFSVARLATSNMLKALNEADPAMLNSSPEFSGLKRNITTLCNQLTKNVKYGDSDMDEILQTIEESLDASSKYLKQKQAMINDGTKMKPITQKRIQAVRDVYEGLQALKKAQLGKVGLEASEDTMAISGMKNFSDGIQRYTKDLSKNDPAFSAALNELPKLAKDIKFFTDKKTDRQFAQILKDRKPFYKNKAKNREYHEKEIDGIATTLARGVMIHVMNRQNPQPSEKTTLEFVKSLYTNAPGNEMYEKLKSVKNNVFDYLMDNQDFGSKAMRALFEKPKLMAEMCSKENTRGSIDLAIKQPNKPAISNPEIQSGGINL